MKMWQLCSGYAFFQRGLRGAVAFPRIPLLDERGQGGMRTTWGEIGSARQAGKGLDAPLRAQGTNDIFFPHTVQRAYA